MSQPQKIFIDTEFIEYPGTLELISIGLITETGQSYYAIADFDYEILKKAPSRQWLEANVLPRLNAGRGRGVPLVAPKSKREIAQDIRTFVAKFSNKPQFCGYYCDYDWVLFCWLFGSMIDLPENYPMFCWDLKQYLDEHQVPRELQPVNKYEHHALFDAINELSYYQKAKEWVEKQARQQYLEAKKGFDAQLARVQAQLGD